MTKIIWLTLLFMLLVSSTVMAARPASVQDLRYSNTGEKIRIVLDMTKETDVKELYLENPSRLIVDIENATLSSNVQKEFLVGSPLANRIRIGQFNADTVRVVVESSSEINIFWLAGGPSGCRLVIDVIQVASVFKDEKPSNNSSNNSTNSPTNNSANDAKTKAEAERKAKQEAERKAKEEKERKAKEEAERKAKEEKERKAKEEAERKAKEEKERKAKEERARKAKEEKERKAKEEAERKAKEEKEKQNQTTTPTNTPRSEVDDDLDNLMTLKGKIIAIDPGHGGNDAGAIGPTGVMEKTVTLNVALELEKMLKAHGATVIMTRRTDKTVSPAGARASAIEELQARCDVANNAKATIFISIHADSFTNPSARGTTGYYYAQTEGQSSIRLADSIRKALCEQIKTPSRGTKPCNFYVVKNTNMPATLIELAFISNPDEEDILSSKDGVLKCAQGIFDGIEDYFG